MTEMIKDRYLLLDKLGQGGFGAVYRALDQVLDREVAIKLLKVNHVNQEEIILRFKSESRLVSRLEHPNVLRVYDFGKDDRNRCYLVTELLKGVSLHALLKSKGALEVSLALDILYQVGAALNVAHTEKVIHRDIKPPNIFLKSAMQGSSFVKLLDFGIAKVLGGDQNPQESLTVTGQIMGTPHYMSPEQIVNIKLVDERSDIYSLGIVFYQMLMGEVPFDDESYFTVMKKQMQNPIPPLSLPHLPASLVEDLQEVVRIMTHKNVERRVKQITEVLAHVERIWHRHASVLSPRTTRSFQAVNSDHSSSPIHHRESSEFESIDQMLGAFQGGDELIDQYFEEELESTRNAQNLEISKIKSTHSSQSSLNQAQLTPPINTLTGSPQLSPLPETEFDLSSVSPESSRAESSSPLLRSTENPPVIEEVESNVDTLFEPRLQTSRNSRFDIQSLIIGVVLALVLFGTILQFFPHPQGSQKLIQQDLTLSPSDPLSSSSSSSSPSPSSLLIPTPTPTPTLPHDRVDAGSPLDASLDASLAPNRDVHDSQVSPLDQATRADHQNTDSTQTTGPKPAVSKAHRPKNQKTNRVSRRRPSMRKHKKVKLKGNVRLSPRSPTSSYLTGDQVKLELVKSNQEIKRLSIHLGACARWISKSQYKIAMKQPPQGQRCVIKLCTQMTRGSRKASKNCIFSREFTVMDPI